MHWERERGVAYLRQIILSQLYLEARMRRLGSIMPPRRRSTRCRVDSATHSHIYCRVQTGARAHTLCTTTRDKGVEEENDFATTWTKTSWLRVLPVAQKPQTCWPRSYPLDRSHSTTGLRNNLTKGFTRCTTTIWLEVFKTSWPRVLPVPLKPESSCLSCCTET